MDYVSKTKKCSKCGEEKPATTELFVHNRTQKGSLNASCKVCNANVEYPGGIPGVEHVMDPRKVFADVYIDDRSLGGLPDDWEAIYDLLLDHHKIENPRSKT